MAATIRERGTGRGTLRMHDQDTAANQLDPHSCRHCGASLDGRPRTQQFCSRTCYQQWWVANRQRETAARGTQKLAQLQATGQDPRSVGETARQRSAKIAESNRRTPRRRKRENAAPVAPVLTAITDQSPRPQIVPMSVAGTHEDDNSDERDWADRGQYWQEVDARPNQRRGKRAEATPLVLTGHGVRLRIEQGALVIRNGFTHYPQPRQEWRLFPGDRRLPSRIVVIDSDGALSLDVIAWLAQQAVPLVLVDWQGQVLSTLDGGGAVSDFILRAAQLTARQTGAGLRLGTQLIAAKVKASMDTVRSLPPSLGRDRAANKLAGALHELQHWPPSDVETLRLIEGRAALAYFTCWESIPLHWKGTGRKPIPPGWHQAGLRQSFVSGTNRHATHPVNAMLNYAYGVLESQVRIATVAAGLDPTIGYLHVCRPGRVALVYDLMEPLRPQVDRLVLDFAQGRTFDPWDFVLTERGVCRLHPELSRTVAGLAVGEAEVQQVVGGILGLFGQPQL